MSLAVVLAGCVQTVQQPGGEPPEESTVPDAWADENWTDAGPPVANESSSPSGQEVNVLITVPPRGEAPTEAQDGDGLWDAGWSDDGDGGDDNAPGHARVLVVVLGRDSGRVLKEEIVHVYGERPTTEVRVVTEGDEDLVVRTRALEGDVDVSVTGSAGVFVEDPGAADPQDVGADGDVGAGFVPEDA